MNKTAAALTIAIILGACTSHQPIGTRSGKPEFTAPAHLSKKEVMNKIAHAMIDGGYDLRRSDDFSLVFGKRLEGSLMHQFLLGSRYDRVPEERIIVNFVETAQGVRTIFTLQYVTNPGSAFERITDMTYSEAGRRLQEQINQGMSASRQGPADAWTPGAVNTLTSDCADPKIRAEFPVRCGAN